MTILAYIRSDTPVTTFTQVNELLAYQVDEMYVEERTLSEAREFSKLINSAALNDVVVVYSLTSIWHIKGIYQYIQQLKELDIRLIAINEKIDTVERPDFYNQMLFFFEVSKEARSEATKRSLDDRRRSGLTLGRPKIDDEVVSKIVMLRDQKYSLRDIAIRCNVSLGTVHKYLNSTGDYKK